MPRTRRASSRRRRRRSTARTVTTTVRRAARRGRRRESRSLLSTKVLPANILVGVAGGVAGFIGTQYAIDKWAPKDWQTGNKRIAAKGIAAVGGWMLGKKVNRPFAAAFSTGAATSAGLDLVAVAMAKKEPGQAGLRGFTAGNDQVRTLGEIDDALAALAAQAGIA